MPLIMITHKYYQDEVFYPLFITTSREQTV